MRLFGIDSSEYKPHSLVSPQWLTADLTESANFIIKLFDIYKKNGESKVPD